MMKKIMNIKTILKISTYCKKGHDEETDDDR